MLESTVEAYFVDRVKASGGQQRKLKWIGRDGAPDRFVKFPLFPVVLVELKAPGKKPQLHQEREINTLRAVGVDVRVIDSKAGVDAFITEATQP